MRIEIVRNKYDGHSTTQMKFPFIDETNYRKMLLFDPTNCLTTIGNIYGKLRLYLLYIKNITAPEPKYENWKMKIECTTKQLEHFIRAPKKKKTAQAAHQRILNCVADFIAHGRLSNAAQFGSGGERKEKIYANLSIELLCG